MSRNKRTPIEVILARYSGVDTRPASVSKLLDSLNEYIEADSNDLDVFEFELSGYETKELRDYLAEELGIK